MNTQAIGQYSVDWSVFDGLPIQPLEAPKTPAPEATPKSNILWEVISKVAQAIQHCFLMIAATFFCCCNRASKEPVSPQPIVLPVVNPPQPLPILFSAAVFDEPLIPDLDEIVTDYLEISDLAVLAKHPTLKFKCAEAFHAFQDALKYIPSSNFPFRQPLEERWWYMFDKALSSEEQEKRLPLALEAIRKIRDIDVNAVITFTRGARSIKSTLLIQALELNKNPKHRLALVKALLAKGADPRMIGHSDYGIEKPIDIAKRTALDSAENDELVKLLEGYLVTHPPLPESSTS